jgi:hypothetical protein
MNRDQPVNYSNPDKIQAQLQYDFCGKLICMLGKEVDDICQTRVKGKLTKENNVRYKDYLRLIVEMGNIRYTCVRLIK